MVFLFACFSERKGKVIPCRGTEDEKGARTNRGKIKSGSAMVPGILR